MEEYKKLVQRWWGELVVLTTLLRPE